LGGELGWLTRRTGLTCDSLVSAEVVTADGQIVSASADSNSDRFWTLRGGGGNFGIVTAFEYALHEAPALDQLGLFSWSVDQGKQARGPASHQPRHAVAITLTWPQNA